ncbi:squalene/phytoene synthase family protein [Sphingosinithalassobacter portus]|uniref:squalene/phytoene synthase family protein n=1 Tax=Stakelama portus TaxID=2676234 RepID=UPI000D6E6C9A|nr:squalene/phytoene synthase family protein [Sphingosinithalassobacter portus]
MTPEEAERQLILTYAPARRRDALAALLALDDALARLLATTSEPALGQIRLQWWRDALQRLDSAPPPAEPVLVALAESVLPAGVSGAALAEIVEGWDVLIESEQLDAEALERFAKGRGETLFALAGTALGARAGDPLAEAGRGWALADLSRHLDRADEAERAREMAARHLEAAKRARWSGAMRALGGMTLLARRDLALPRGGQPPVGSPARLARLLWHRISGR